MNADLDDADKLESFFAVMLEFNKKVPLNQDYKDRI